MSKKYALLWLIMFLAFLPKSSLAYNLGIQVDKQGNATYSSPAVLGKDDDKETENTRPSHPPEPAESAKPLKPPKTPRPEKIEIKTSNNETKVTVTGSDKNRQELKVTKVDLKFSAFPKFVKVPDSKPKETNHGELKPKEGSTLPDIKQVIKERQDRVNETINIHNDVGGSGQVELQLESRAVKAKISNSEIELDVKDNNIGVTDNTGTKVDLIHLPDQAEKRFLDLGISSTPGTLEVGPSGNGIIYSTDMIKPKKLFGLIPHSVTYKVKLNDATGEITQTEVNKNAFQQFLNKFSF